jgi:hypothetical protein
MRKATQPVMVWPQEQYNAIKRIKSLAAASTFTIFRNFAKSPKKRYRFGHGFLRVHSEFEETLSKLGPVAKARIRLPSFESHNAPVSPGYDIAAAYGFRSKPVLQMRGMIEPDPEKEESKASDLHAHYPFQP